MPNYPAAQSLDFPAVRRRVFYFAVFGLLAVVIVLAVFDTGRPLTSDEVAQQLLNKMAEMSTVINWSLAPGLIAAGIVVGFFMGMLGMGGGVFKVSCMLIVFKMDIFFARAVSIITMFFASTTALWQHVKGRPILWSYAKPILLGAIPAAITGAILGNSLQSAALTHVFGFFTLFLAFSVLGLVFGDPSEGAITENFCPAPTDGQRKVCIALGVGHGLVSGMLGISGGVIACPAQQMALNMPLRDAITNTLLSSAIVTGLASVIVVWVGISRGDYSIQQIIFVDVLMGGACAIGAPLGARVGKRCPVIILHLIDFILVFGAGVSILF